MIGATPQKCGVRVSPSDFMLTSFSPKNLAHRPEHDRSAAYFAALLHILSQPKLDANIYPQSDGSRIYKFNEVLGTKNCYYIRMYPDGSFRGGREVPISE